jgi:hypothetical protein
MVSLRNVPDSNERASAERVTEARSRGETTVDVGRFASQKDDGVIREATRRGLEPVRSADESQASKEGPAGGRPGDDPGALVEERARKLDRDYTSP